MLAIIILAQVYLSSACIYSIADFSMLHETAPFERSSRERGLKNLLTSVNWCKSWHLKLQCIQLHMRILNLRMQIFSLTLAISPDTHFQFPQMFLKWQSLRTFQNLGTIPFIWKYFLIKCRLYYRIPHIIGSKLTKMCLLFPQFLFNQE